MQENTIIKQTESNTFAAKTNLPETSNWLTTPWQLELDYAMVKGFKFIIAADGSNFRIISKARVQRVDCPVEMLDSKTQIDKVETILDKLDLAHEFIKFREKNKDNPEIIIEKFFDSVNLPEDLRNDFMVAALLKQVHDLDIVSGKITIEDLYRQYEVNEEVVDTPKKVLMEKSGSHINISIIRKRYNALQANILKGGHDA